MTPIESYLNMIGQSLKYLNLYKKIMLNHKIKKQDKMIIIIISIQDILMIKTVNINIKTN